LRRPTLLAKALPRALPAVAAATGLAAQEEERGIPGVELGIVVEDRYVPPVAVRPFTLLIAGDDALGREIELILARDLDHSDRFAVRDTLPAEFAGGAVQYALWEQFQVDWLVAGTLEGDATGEGRILTVELHDVVYGSLHERERFVLPEPGSADFRMAVHAVSDALVEWVSGERGMAATRVVLAMRAFGEERGKELYVVDADGENLQRLTWDQSIVASPTWSPDGTRIAYTSWKSGVPRLYERDLETGRDRELVPGGHGHQLTPSYHPDGHTVAFSVIGAEPNGLHTYNIRDGCCMARLGGGAYHDISPGYSPDGTRLVFNSNRLGVATPQVYVRPAGSGSAELLSPYRFGEGGYFADPDWSPGSSKVAFAGGIRGRRQANRYNILVADFEKGDNRLVQLTREGNNEDPSWAPDDRHIVFKGTRSYGTGVFIVDAATGRTRILVANVLAEDPDWSPPLAGNGGDG